MITRKEQIDSILEDKAWRNHKRPEIKSDKHSAQEILDFFRDYLCRHLAIMRDADLPDNDKQEWDFIYSHWNVFKKMYSRDYTDAS